MIHMASRLPNTDAILPSEQTAPLMTPRSIPYMPGIELPPAHAEEIIRNHEFAKAREAFQRPPEWLDAKRHAQMQNMPLDIQKREWLARAEQREQEYNNRKHMEQDAYYRANQEYVRLMTDDQNRQSFREKQRLTEDLEKQKRLLIEDLARDQQLRQDKYKRDHDAAMVNDIRTMQYVNKKPFRNEFLNVRGRPEHAVMHPFPPKHHPYNSRIEGRVDQRLSSPHDIYNLSRISDVIMPNKAMVMAMKEQSAAEFNMKQCKHSDLPPGQRSLIPIIQEKEKKIKEMENRILEYTRESRDRRSKDTLSIMEDQRAKKSRDVAVTLKSSTTLQKENMQRDIPSPDLIIDVTNDDSSQQPAAPPLLSVANEEKPAKNTVESENKFSAEGKSVNLKTEDKVELITESPATVKEKTIENNNTEMEEESIYSDSGQHVSATQVKNSPTKKEESEITTDAMDSTAICHEEKIGSKEGNHNANTTCSDTETVDHNMNIKSQRKKQKQKNANKKSEVSTDFKASQNRLALDLPNHNWLVERLKQQNKLVERDVSASNLNKNQPKDTKDEIRNTSDVKQRKYSLPSEKPSSPSLLNQKEEQSKDDDICTSPLPKEISEKTQENQEKQAKSELLSQDAPVVSLSTTMMKSQLTAQNTERKQGNLAIEKPKQWLHQKKEEQQKEQQQKEVYQQHKHSEQETKQQVKIEQQQLQSQQELQEPPQMSPQQHKQQHQNQHHQKQKNHQQQQQQQQQQQKQQQAQKQPLRQQQLQQQLEYGVQKQIYIQPHKLTEKAVQNPSQEEKEVQSQITTPPPPLSQNIAENKRNPIVTASGINEIKILSVMSLSEAGHMSDKKVYVKDSNANIVNVSLQNEGKTSAVKNIDDVKVESFCNRSNDINTNNAKSKMENDSTIRRPNEINDINEKEDKMRRRNVEIENNSSKDLSHSKLLLRMLDPKSSNPQLSSPNRINPPEVGHKMQHVLPKTSLATSLPPALLAKKLNNHEKVVVEDTIAASVKIQHKHSSRPTVYRGEPPALTSSILPIQEGSQRHSHIHTSSAPLERTYVQYPERSPGVQRARSEDSAQQSPYQVLPSNLVVMTRKESDSQPFTYPQQYPYPHPTVSQIPYSKYLVEERYNRKRPIEEEQNRAILEMERVNRMRQLSDMQKRASEDRRYLRSAPPLEISQIPKDEIRISGDIANREYNSLSRNIESRSYKINEPLHPSPVRVKMNDLLETQTHYARARYSPSSYVHTNTDERLPDNRIHPYHRRLPPEAETVGSADAIYENGLKLSPRELLRENPLYSKQMREREIHLIQEARKREEIQRIEKLNQYPGHAFRDPKTTIVDDARVPLNERIRTVDDLRVLQLGFPLGHTVRQPNRQVVRDDRLTEREKLALREAEINNTQSLRPDTIVPRPGTHEIFLEQAQRERTALGKPSPLSIPNGIPRLTKEQLLAIRRHEEEERLRFRAHPVVGRIPLQEPREPMLIPTHKEMPHSHIDATVPRFYSHKIPRTRNGSLDFGRSKPVDYSFLDYSASIREREGLPTHEEISLKRASSTNPPEPLNKFSRRSPPQTYVSAELYKRLSQDEINQKEKTEQLNDRHKTQEDTEKRHCKICSKDAQYLCSGCRKAWYCSQKCQLSEWRSHSRTCAGEI